jgi:phage replication O-like protein O
MSNVVPLWAEEPLEQVDEVKQERVVADVDKGFYRVANEIAEAKCALKLSGVQWQVYNAIERYTFGYNRKSDRIANVQICDITELNPAQVSDALKELEQRKIITRSGDKHKMKVVAINKVISDWVLRKHRTNVIKTDNNDYQNREPKLSKLVNTKDSFPKTVTKEDKKTLCRDKPRPTTGDDVSRMDEPKPDLLTIPAIEVITYLNQATGSRYSLKPDGNAVKGTRGRLADGFSVEELKRVIDFKLAEWGQDSKMRQYLRPSTLFRPNHCPAYLQAAQAWAVGGQEDISSGVSNAAPSCQNTD